jgi:hypothetical protein
MRSLILLAVTAISLAACAPPTLNGANDAQGFSGEPHAMAPTGPYDNTANSLGGRYIGGGD